MGVVGPNPGFLQGLRDLCDREGALLIFDEVITGFRLAKGGAGEYYGVRADLVKMCIRDSPWGGTAMAEKGYRFPLFVDLRGRRAVVVGGGPVALRRAKALLDFGAQVTLIAPQCEAVPPGADYLQRPYAPGDVEGAFLVVAATDDRLSLIHIWPYPCGRGPRPPASGGPAGRRGTPPPSPAWR